MKFLRWLRDLLFPIVCEGHRFHSWGPSHDCPECEVIPYVGSCVRSICGRCKAESHHYPSER